MNSSSLALTSSKERYRNDWRFHLVVEEMRIFLRHSKLSLDLEYAVSLAHELHNEDTLRNARKSV